MDRSAEIDGAALEGLVAQHLRAWIALSDGTASLHYWRTPAGREVDFVVYGESAFWAIEVKNAARVHATDLGGLKAFRQDYPEATPLLLHRGRETLRIDGIACVPVEDFLRGVVPGSPLHDAGAG
jgi:predicted AAA+ superfamily ATPase